MIRITVIFLLLIGFYLSFSGCQRTCENVKVGEVDFAPATNSFLLYQDDQELTFQNDQEDAIAFTVMRTESNYFICQKITCTPIDPYKSSFCEYIEAPSVEIILQTDSLLLVLNAGIFAYEPETELLYDALRFSVSYVNESLTASHITDIGFDEPVFDQDYIQDIDRYSLFAGRLTLQGRAYDKVHYFETESLAFYFAEGTGFVAFKINNELYTLQ